MSVEIVAVVFTDLVGSTALLSRVGEDAAEELRREHFGLLRAAVEPGGGREVKNLGDGLMIVFDSAAEAVAAAVRIQQEFDLRNRRAEHALQVRIGIALGDADVDDEDYFGIPVVQAARLCAKCDADEILVTDVVRMLTGTRGGLTFESLGELELKGLDEPVGACRVVWSPLDPVSERPPFPPRLAAALSANFVGRRHEHDQLVAAWKSVASDDERRIMMLGGEPGIGKTTLAARLASEVYDHGALVLYGRSDEDVGQPYQPWIAMLTQLVAVAPERLLADHLAQRGNRLVRFVPELGRVASGGAPAAIDEDSERFALFDCVADLLERASDEQPVLLVLDDLHWADRASVQMLRHMVMSPRRLRVALLGTFRDSDITSDHPLTELLAALHREQGSVRLALRGFSDDDLLDLLETIAGHEMDEQGVALRDALLAETEGNPFFVAEILRHLAETGAIYQQPDGRWTADTDIRAMGLPVSVREVVGRRLARLGPEAQRVLALGAVIGRDFDVSLLAAIAHTDEDSLIDMCDTAVDAAILQTTGNPDHYTFAHALIEHALYDGLSPSRRARAHKAVAEQLEASGAAERGRVGELAYHWSEAVQPTDLSKAIEYTTLAAAQALDQSAPDDALRWSVQALELLDRSLDVDGLQRAAILIGLGTAQRQCGIAAYRETLLEAARLADEFDAIGLLVRAAIANNRGFQSEIGRTDYDRVAVIERALDRLGPEPTGDRARLLGVLSVERFYEDELDERRVLVEQAVATARASGDDAAFLFAVTQGCNSIPVPSTLAMREAWVREACTIADRLGDSALLWSVHSTRLLTALMAGDGDAFFDAYVVLEEAATRVPHATVRWNTAYHAALLAIVRGELAEAEALAEAAFALGAETGHADAIAIFGPQLVNIRDHQGRLAEMLPLIEQAVADSPGLPAYRAVLVNTMVAAGQHEEARARLERDLATGLEMRFDNAWTTAMSNWARAAAALHVPDAAAAVRERITPYHDQIATTQITIDFSLAHLLGLLDHSTGDLDSADRWFHEAMELHQRLHSPLLIAYTQAAWACTLAERANADDRARASAMAGEALEQAVAAGYGTVERDARAALDRLA